MKSNIEKIVDDNGFELVVSYKYEVSPSYYAEKDNPGTYVVASVGFDIEAVGLYFANEIVVMPVKLLSEKQKEFIISKLTHSND